MKKDKHVSLRIDERLHNKLRYICAYEGRSINAQILFLVRRCAEAFEIKHGKLDMDDKDNRIL